MAALDARRDGRTAVDPGGGLDHEDAHAWQWAALLGLPFLLSAGWSWLRTGDPASRNMFERHAGLARGGYVERPVTNSGLRAAKERLSRGVAGVHRAAVTG